MKKLLIASLFLTACVGSYPDIKPKSEWQDIGKPTGAENIYTIIKVEDDYVFDIDSKGITHRVPIETFRKYCVEKQGF